MLSSLRSPIRCPLRVHFRHLRCKCSAPDISFYRESFARRMALAGIKPHHNIALGVSGGPDSMALCVLTAGWKSEGLSGTGGSCGYIDGLLGIVVDHRLRPESAEEARIVQERVMKMGIRCNISCCNWPEGRPKVGNLQEAARNMRYQIFQDVCAEQQIAVVLVAHHADDQICQGGNQIWVEDPTNRSTLFTRNRIRSALSNLPSSFRSEMQAFISTCRLTRLFVENICHKMFEHSVSIMDEGYSIIDLEKLGPSNVDDLCLSNFLVMILQFISQRKRPIRGSVKRLLLDYIRNLPCKVYLDFATPAFAPRSKGTKVIVCYSPESPFSAGVSLSSIYHEGHLSYLTDHIIRDAKFHSDKLVGQASNIPFFDAKSSEAVLREAVQLKLISQSTYTRIRLLQIEESERFCSQNGLELAYDSVHHTKDSSSSNAPLYPGHWYHFMRRFLVTWKYHERRDDVCSDLVEFNHKSEANENKACQYCGITRGRPLIIRHMVDADWLYLAKISKSHTDTEDTNELQTSNYTKSSAQAALNNLRNLPAAARRALPLFVDAPNLPLCIPSIGFSCCPCLDIVAEFRPRVPLGGGYSSYL